MAYNFTSDELVPLASSVARRIEVHATTVCIHDVSVNRSAIAEYLQEIDAANNAVFDQSGNPIASAGRITSLQTTARQIQLGLRLTW